jgi:hypothetical protein
MASPDSAPSEVAPDGRPLRIFLPPPAARHVRSCFDGAWWPYSDDLGGQAVELAQAVGANWGGRVERMTYDPSIWSVTNRKLVREGPALRMGWFRSREPNEVTLVLLDGRRVELLVVPPATPARRADWVMHRALEQGSAAHAKELLSLAQSVD